MVSEGSWFGSFYCSQRTFCLKMRVKGDKLVEIAVKEIIPWKRTSARCSPEALCHSPPRLDRGEKIQPKALG